MRRICSERDSLSVSAGEIWSYRELLLFLILRDLKIKYRQTLIGVSWVIIQPFLSSLIFSVIFGRFLGLGSSGSHPYLVIVLCAFLPWNLFANSTSMSVDSLVMSRDLVTKVYFPRIILPTYIILKNLIDFCITTAFFVVILFIYNIRISPGIVYLPLFLLLGIILAMGVSFWLSALNVRYRDIRNAVPFLIQIWFYCSPVAYTAKIIPAHWKFLYYLNPMAVIIDGFRWSFLGTPLIFTDSFPLAFIILFLIFLGGLLYFLKTEDSFADIV
ncbi:MAG: ABC transporter permease [Candidatus Omnitrophica bacterium]|nr:ABC transporter permease [Candidatus Omnitrophota bacterium]MDD5652855.1 ABC transporter permease [Candidatus Omnitrophota bacterium]